MKLHIIEIIFTKVQFYLVCMPSQFAWARLPRDALTKADHDIVYCPAISLIFGLKRLHRHVSHIGQGERIVIRMASFRVLMRDSKALLGRCPLFALQSSQGQLLLAHCNISSSLFPSERICARTASNTTPATCGLFNRFPHFLDLALCFVVSPGLPIIL